MLRVNVGLSRKLSKDYNSTGFSINLDGEVSAPVSDPEAVIEQVKELFDLAEEALGRQIEGANGDAAIASRDEEPAPSQNGNARSAPPNGRRSYTNGIGRQNGNGQSDGNGHTEPEAATSKQINYLLNIGKRNRLSTVQLEKKVEEILGTPIGLYDLSKRDAGRVIDALTNESANGHAGTRR